PWSSRRCRGFRRTPTRPSSVRSRAISSATARPPTPPPTRRQARCCSGPTESAAFDANRNLAGLRGRRFDQTVKLDPFAAVVEPAALRLIPVEVPGAVAERDPQLPRRRLRRQHQPLLLEEGDGQRALRDRDLRDVGIDARVGVVQQVAVAFFVEGHAYLRENAIQKSKPARRTSIGNMSPALYPPSAAVTSAGVRTAALPIRSTISPVFSPA